ncbi:MAG: 50S ribosome-binding GTPase [Desulfobacterales bacterium]|nr:50S ribosome-binding GTPase [Desulfobacterales bacterium]
MGYTNAGKSTLLNALTNSDVLVEDRLFATLDPKSSRLRFPRDTEAVITDTVGFIRDLPKELVAAFRATLEELHEADVLLHLIDVSNADFEEHIVAVEKILGELGIAAKPTIRVFNKDGPRSPTRSCSPPCAAGSTPSPSRPWTRQRFRPSWTSWSG